MKYELSRHKTAVLFMIVLTSSTLGCRNLFYKTPDFDNPNDPDNWPPAVAISGTFTVGHDTALPQYGWAGLEFFSGNPDDVLLGTGTVDASGAWSGTISYGSYDSIVAVADLNRRYSISGSVQIDPLFIDTNYDELYVTLYSDLGLSRFHEIGLGYADRQDPSRWRGEIQPGFYDEVYAIVEVDYEMDWQEYESPNLGPLDARGDGVSMNLSLDGGWEEWSWSAENEETISGSITFDSRVSLSELDWFQIEIFRDPFGISRIGSGWDQGEGMWSGAIIEGFHETVYVWMELEYESATGDWEWEYFTGPAAGSIDATDGPATLNIVMDESWERLDSALHYRDSRLLVSPDLGPMDVLSPEPLTMNILVAYDWKLKSAGW